MEQAEANYQKELSDKKLGFEREIAQSQLSLIGEKAKAQQEIAKLNELRAPIAAENRKIEAEVGPIKYIAALIYGDNPDNNLLERAVRWVIILIVLVFDPLALMLVIAANTSRNWEKKDIEKNKQEPNNDSITDSIIIKPITESVEQPVQNLS